MGETVDVFPDAEALLSTIIRNDLGARVYSSIPANPTYPLILVSRIGGLPAHRAAVDQADIQVEVWGTSKSEARLLAVQARASLFEAMGSRHLAPTVPASAQAFLSSVRDILGLQWMPDPSNTTKNRYIFSVRATLRTT